MTERRDSGILGAPPNGDILWVGHIIDGDPTRRWQTTREQEEHF